MRLVGHVLRWLPVLIVMGWALVTIPDEVTGVRHLWHLSIAPLNLIGLLLVAHSVARLQYSRRAILWESVPPGIIWVCLATLGGGPWPLWATVLTVLVGGSWTLTHSVRVLIADEPQGAQQAVLWGVALAGVGLNSPLGVVAAIWALLTASALGSSADRNLRLPLPFGLTFVAWWFGVAAAVASQSWLLVAVLMLAALSCGIGEMRSMGMDGRRRYATLSALGYGLWFVGPLLLAPFTQRFISPVTAQLAIGLNQLGTVELWAWLGVGARNAGQQRVMVLPVVVWWVLAVVISATVFIARPPQRPALMASLSSSEQWQAIRRQVWWLGRG